MSRSASRPRLRPGARAPARSSSYRGSATSWSATSPPLRRCSASTGPRPAAASGRPCLPQPTSTVTAMSTCSPVPRAPPRSQALPMSCAACPARPRISQPPARASPRPERERRPGAPSRRASPWTGATSTPWSRRRAHAARSSWAAARRLRHSPLRRPRRQRPARTPRRPRPRLGRQEEDEEAAAMPAQEAEAEVPRRQGQAREGEAQALPPGSATTACSWRSRSRRISVSTCAWASLASDSAFSLRSPHSRAVLIGSAIARRPAVSSASVSRGCG